MMADNFNELQTRVAVLEQRATTMETDKSKVTDRITALEVKAAVAIAIAIILGLGGAGIGALFLRASDQISDLRKQADNQISELRKQADNLKLVIESQKEQVNQQVREAGKSLRLSPLGAEIRTIKAPNNALAGLNVLQCGADEVLVGVDLSLGGTCHNQCEPDGRPIAIGGIVGRCKKIDLSVVTQSTPAK
jgi:hypothetical protein